MDEPAKTPHLTTSAMSLLSTIRIALRALARGKLRAGLTVLGVMIGVAAVTTVVSIGQGANKLVMAQFETVGTNVIVIMPGSHRSGGVHQGVRPTLTAQDSDAIAEECPSVLATSPLVGTAGQVIHESQNWRPQRILGVGESYLTVRDWQLTRGGFFTAGDITSAGKVCLIGQTLVARLFQTRNPIGATVRVKNVPFRVIGVLEGKGANLGGEDQDDILLIPYTTVRRRLEGSNFNDVHAILASARSPEQMSEAKVAIKQLLLERHAITPGGLPDFEVYDMTEVAKAFTKITGTLTLMLSAIAGISLIVGGVSIMNIMLVSVTERTREIGIRMAVGARPRDILRQFLAEAVMLSCLGGVVGFGLGVMVSACATVAINSFVAGTNWPMVISLRAAVVAFLFAAGVGICSGYYPAWRASRLDPIDALRYE
jgi:putative ABC transport system permease protein